jgi:ribosomal-protein-serine acetyltransferase
VNDTRRGPRLHGYPAPAAEPPVACYTSFMGAKHATDLRPRMPSFRLGPDAILSPLEARDADDLLAVVNRNRTRLRKWLSWVDHHRDFESIQAMIAMTHRDFERERALRLGIRQRGVLAGIAALQRVDLLNRSGSLGYWIDEGHEGQGLISAAVVALCHYGMEDLGLGRIEIAAATDNARSIAVARRLGFQLEGVLRCREWLNDHYVDHAVYSLTVHDPVPALEGVGRLRPARRAAR